MVHRVIILAATVSFLGTAQACWEQCGGTGWTGIKTCSDGCVCTYQNDWYSQCLPGSATTTKSPTTTSSTSKSSTTTSTSGSTSGPKYWFSFGDSYTATSFDISSTKPNDANPFGNPAYPGYTACGQVTNWIDEMVVSYNEAKIYAYNFAYGGATIDATIVPPYTSTVLSMTDQMNEFLNNVASHPSYAPWTSANSIFSFFIGINDVSGTWYKDWGNWTAYTPTLMNAYFALVQKAYNAGARNFLFINVPCVDRSPYAASMDVTSPLGTAIKGYNAELINRVNTFKAANSGVTAWIYDSNTRLGQILDSPATYGFQDATSYGAGSNLAWCNDFHVSPGVHHYFAKDIAGVLSGSGF